MSTKVQLSFKTVLPSMTRKISAVFIHIQQSSDSNTNGELTLMKLSLSNHASESALCNHPALQRGLSTGMTTHREEDIVTLHLTHLLSQKKCHFYSKNKNLKNNKCKSGKNKSCFLTDWCQNVLEDSNKFFRRHSNSSTLRK
ncbi:hypothetical protein CEXT_30321 [Caerostris extrusa]|uniref:Uncharacterized protein n=1 Tax=Caerostris extrusa TaxID=172846 RepID=A0AAV4T1T4_CAEEX|nr:hypothetical protein CEXT_30321 [Caerostris extrusa]